MANLARAKVTSGFGFLEDRAGFAIAQSLISYSAESTYARAFLVGLLNTLLVTVIGIVLSTLVGFVIGVARLSQNWLLARLATVYVETFRNVPVLLQLLFWYRAVLAFLPRPREGFEFPFGIFLSNRGLQVPRPLFGPDFLETLVAIVVAVIAVFALGWWAKRRRLATGKPFPTVRTGVAILFLLPALVFLATGTPLTFEYPVLKGFNFNGGVRVSPEFLALVLGLVLYTAAFIAEIVRAGILAVSRGQVEAGLALGLTSGQAVRRIVIPQALRVVIPPLTGQYLNLTKNSSLAVAIGYPDLVSVFAGTALGQSGQAIEVIFITMIVYLAISLATSLFMNWFNSRVALVGDRG
jgi:general L-amino acid transport system permease protein